MPRGMPQPDALVIGAMIRSSVVRAVIVCAYFGLATASFSDCRFLVLLAGVVGVEPHVPPCRAVHSPYPRVGTTATLSAPPTAFATTATSRVLEAVCIVR